MGLGAVAAASLHLLLFIVTLTGPFMTCLFASLGLALRQQILTLLTHGNSVSFIDPEISWTQVCARTDIPAVWEGLYREIQSLTARYTQTIRVLSISLASVAI